MTLDPLIGSRFQCSHWLVEVAIEAVRLSGIYGGGDRVVTVVTSDENLNLKKGKIKMSCSRECNIVLGTMLINGRGTSWVFGSALKGDPVK